MCQRSEVRGVGLTQRLMGVVVVVFKHPQLQIKISLWLEITLKI